MSDAAASRRRSPAGRRSSRSRTAAPGRTGRTPSANAPSRKYFSAASCDSSRRRRDRPAIRYSGSDSTSSATNISSRLFEIGKISMPETANSSSGKISVWIRSLSCQPPVVGEPTTTAAEATIGLPTSTLRSAISSVAMIARTRMVPCRNNPAAVRPTNASGDGRLARPVQQRDRDDRARPGRRA